MAFNHRNRGASNLRGGASNHRNPGVNWYDEVTTDDEVQKTTEAMRLPGKQRAKTLAKDDATSEVESGNDSSTSGFVNRKSRTKKRYRDDANTGIRRPRPRGSGLGGGDIGINRGNNSGRGRGRGGRQFTGNGNGRNGNNFTNLNPQISHKEAAGTAAQPKNKNWPSMAVKNINQSAGSPATVNRDPTHQNPNIPINESESNTASYLESNRSNESASSDPDPLYAKSQNPTYAAKIAEQLEAAERILIVQFWDQRDIGAHRDPIQRHYV
jgi:hypothetical protein